MAPNKLLTRSGLIGNQRRDHIANLMSESCAGVNLIVQIARVFSRSSTAGELVKRPEFPGAQARFQFFDALSAQD